MSDFYCVELKNSQSEKDNIVYILRALEPSVILSSFSQNIYLLLNITVTEESPGYWKVENRVLSDLSTLNLSLKNEFNASKKDLMDEKSIIMTGTI